MDSPKISWYIKDTTTSSYNVNTDYYAGTYIQNKTPITINMRIWNNRYGTTDVQSISNLKLFLFFSNYEDNSLLKYITVSTNNLQGDNTITDSGLTVTFIDPVTLSGVANNGADSNLVNYTDVTLIFNPTTTIDLKNFDLKNLFIKLV